MPTSLVQVKYRSTTHAVQPGTVAQVKRALVELTHLPAHEMKLCRAGKILAAPDAVIEAGSKMMLMRSAAPTPMVGLNVREIVTGRVAPHLEVAPTTPHDALIADVVKALRLPPCDEHTEVRLFLPSCGNVLMRTDLALSDYTLPPPGQPLDVFAVPCPIMPPQPVALGLQASGEAEEEAEEEARAFDALAAQAHASLSAADAEAMRYALEALPGGGMLQLPPSLSELLNASTPSFAEMLAAEEAMDEAADAPANAPAASSSAASSAAAEKPPPHPASLVPTRLRTGLMPAHDEMSPRVVELPASLLAAEALEAYEASFALPTTEEWAAYAAAEESRLESRCAELIATLAPELPPPASPRAKGRARKGAVHEREPPSTSAASRRRTTPYRHRAGASVSPLKRGAGGEVRARARWEDLESSTSSCGTCVEDDDDDALSDAEEGAHEAVHAARGFALFADLELRDEDGGPRSRLELAGEASPMPAPKGSKVQGSVCKSCSCRLPLTACAARCKCGEVFCPAHMHEHACRVNYRKAQRAKLTEDNPKLESQKLERL